MSREDVVDLLKDAARRGATEIHFKVPNRPQFRIAGGLVESRRAGLEPRSAQDVAFAICSLAKVERPVAAITEEEVSFGLAGVGRFRACLYRQRGSISVVVQRVATELPDWEELGLTEEVAKLANGHGLVLVCGARRVPAMAAMVQRFNTTQRGHAVVLEAPLTYLYRDARASIAHREVGCDVPDFASGIQQARRMRADWLVVGDVSDPKTADALLTAAEDGIPTLATVGAPSAADATWWVTRQFLGEARTDTKRRLVRVLRGVIAVPERGAVEVQAGQVAQGQQAPA